jgi:hypothetical protein
MAGVFDNQVGLFEDKTGVFDDGGIDTLASVSFTSGTPYISSVDFTQVYVFIAANITTGTSFSSPTAISQNHNLGSTNIISGAVSFGTVIISQDQNLGSTNIVSGAVSIPTVTIQQDHSLSATDITTDAVVISTALVSEVYNLSPTNLVAGQPSVNAVTATVFIGLQSILTGRPELGEAYDPDAIIIVEIEEAQRMFGGLARRAYEVPDGRLVQGEREVYSTYGQRVSIDAKAKSLLKFGKSGNLSTNAGLQTVWSVDGNETYISTNLIDSVVSSSASDTQEVTIEGHTIEGSGVDAKFTFVVQTATLSGQTPVALTTPLARASRVNNNSSTEIVGVVSVYEDSAVTGGVPNDVTKVHIDIPLGFQQSFKAATTFSNTDYFFLTGCYGAVSQKQTAAADFYIELREVGKSFRQIACLTASSTGGAFNIEFDPAIIIPRNADVRIRCTTGTNNAVVFTNFRGYLAKVVT